MAEHGKERAVKKLEQHIDIREQTPNPVRDFGFELPCFVNYFHRAAHGPCGQEVPEWAMVKSH